MRQKLVHAAAVAAALATAAITHSVTGQAVVPGGPNKLAYPEGWDKQVLYATVDRYDTKQFREFYTSPEAVQAAREGKPIPDGTVITLAAYMARLDAAGNPVKDANGRFIKDKLVALNAMQKKAGWGQDIPADLRNGDWIYQSFSPEGKVNDKANLSACYQCHLPFARDDYLTNLAKLSDKFPTQAKAPASIGPGDVAISGFTFGPGSLKVAAGQVVTWINGDDTPHQVTLSGANGKRSDVMLKGQTANMRFEQAGTFAYICGLHPTMKGTVEVAAR